MANRAPEWIKESFNTFRPGPISDTAMPGTWLSVRTDTPGQHKFTDQRYTIEPDPGLSDGVHVNLEGPGVVTFKLNEPVMFLFFTMWAPGGSGWTGHLRYFGVTGETLRETDHRLEQDGDLAMFDSPEPIAGVEISRNDASPHDFCVDNFSTIDEDELKSLKALGKKDLTTDDILNLRRKR